MAAVGSLRRSDSARQVTRLDSARQQGCVSGEVEGGAKCPRDFRLAVDTRVSGYQSDDSLFARDVRMAVQISVTQAGFYPLKLEDANAADSALYIIVEIKRTMSLDRESLRIDTSLGGREAPARSCYKTWPGGLAWGEPASQHITLGVVLRSVVEQLARCAQRVRSASG